MLLFELNNFVYLRCTIGIDGWIFKLISSFVIKLCVSWICFLNILSYLIFLRTVLPGFVSCSRYFLIFIIQRSIFWSFFIRIEKLDYIWLIRTMILIAYLFIMISCVPKEVLIIKIKRRLRISVVDSFIAFSSLRHEPFRRNVMRSKSNNNRCWCMR